MGLAKSAAWMFCGWVIWVGVGHAQEAANPNQAGKQPGQAQREPEAGEQSGSRQYDRLLREADELITKGKSADAYALLEPLELEHAGEQHFDYLLGVAALDSGKPDKATLAFERVLMVNPNHVAARLEMARAYYQLGDMLRAKAEFETVLQQNPPSSTRATIQKYLDAIAALDPARKTHVSGYAEGTVGRDSNVNNSTTQSQVTVNIPAVGPVVAALTPTNLKSPDNYYGVAAGGAVAHSLSPSWGLYAGADLNQRTYNAQKNFDAMGAEARAGAIYGAEADRVRFGMLGGIYNLGGTRNRNAAGLNADWGHTLSPSNQMSLFGQYLQYRFADIAMQVNDFNQQAVGAGWAHVLADGKSVLSAALYTGSEQDTSSIITTATPNGGRTDGVERFNGVRVGGQTFYGENTVLFASAGWQGGRYSRINPFFLVQRADRFHDLTLGADWHWDKLWSLRPQVTFFRNNSNIVIYSYNRTDVSLTLRREFK